MVEIFLSRSIHEIMRNNGLLFEVTKLWSWMASLTWWTWVWASSRSWWWTGNSGVLQSMGSWRVKYDWATELNWSFGVIHYTEIGHYLDTQQSFWSLKAHPSFWFCTLASICHVPSISSYSCNEDLFSSYFGESLYHLQGSAQTS